MLTDNIDSLQGAYANSVKQPDFTIRHNTEVLPSVTIEARWSETYPKLVQDTEVWMVGDVAVTNVSLLVKFHRRVGDRIASFVEVARRVPGGVGGWDQRQVSCNTPMLPL